MFQQSQLKQVVSLAMGTLIVGAMCLDPDLIRVQAEPVYSMAPAIHVPNGAKLVSVDASNEDLRQVLYDLAQKMNVNLMLSDSVSGKITIRLTQVPLDEALKAIAVSANLDIIPKEGGIFVVVDRETARDNGLNRGFSKVIKVNYSNATRLSTLLNMTLFNQGGMNGMGNANIPLKVLPDARTNSLVIVGTNQEIAVAERAIAQLDQPRQSRTFYLSNANALNVASLLASSVFNDGTAQLNVGGAGGAGGGAGGAGANGNNIQPVMPAQMTVERETIEEGTGINNFGGASGGNSTAGLGQSITLRGTVKESTTLSISPEGPIIVPDTRTNSVTIMGTAEQLALAESMIPIMDSQLPQVSIEVSLVEITQTGLKELGSSFGVGAGSFQFGFNNQARAYNASSIGIPTVDNTAGATSAIGVSTNPLSNNRDFTTQIRALLRNNKAKILANPTVVATHDTESVISIVDEIIRRTTVEQANSINGLTTQQVEIGEAGIVLDILPKVGEDGTVTMRLRPSVSSVRDNTQTDAFGNAVTLLSKRDYLAQSVRVQDGETIVMGGLVQERDSNVTQKMPGLASLPIVGAMFRAASRTATRSELVLMVTPHIMNKTDLTPVNYVQSSFAR